MPMLVAAQTATNSAMSPMNRRMRPLKKPPAAYARMNRIGTMSTSVTCRQPLTARVGVRNYRRFSLSEPGAVLFLQPQPDVRHDSVHFGVRKGAFRASESQGKRDALVSLGNLRATVFVERAHVLQEIAGRFFDGRQHRSRRDRVLDDHRQVAVDAGEAGQRPGPRRMRGAEQR